MYNSEFQATMRVARGSMQPVPAQNNKKYSDDASTWTDPCMGASTLLQYRYEYTCARARTRVVLE